MAKILRIVTIGAGGTFDAAVGPDFNFNQCCAEVRDLGYWFNGANAYVPYSSIAGMFVVDTSMVPAGSNVIPIGGLQ